MQIQELIEQAVAASTADGCIVVGDESTQANLRWAGNNLTTNGQMHSRSLTIVSTFDGADGTSAGVVTRAVSTADEVLELVRASEQAGRGAGPSDDAAPIVANYQHGDDWSAEPARTDIDVLADFARGLGAEFGRWRENDRLLFGYAEHTMSAQFVATSTGLRRRFDQPNGTVWINGKSADFARSGFVGQHTTDFSDVDVAAIGAELDRRLDWAAKRIDLPAGRYETIMPPSTVADLMVYAYWTASARDAEEGRNVYAARSDSAGSDGSGGTRIGEALSPHPLHLYSDPGYQGLQCAPFEVITDTLGGLRSVFDNGAPVPAGDWISDGRLRDLIRTRAWAAKTGAEPRPFAGNLILENSTDGGPTVQEMVAATERGLLLTCLWYIREVDPQTLLLTGLTRDGVYLVENGEVVGAVNNFRFNESPVDLLSRATEVGRTERALSREWGEYLSRTAMPALRIPDFNMSTVSQAS
jgi:predicted Zn-dependent protease